MAVKTKNFQYFLFVLCVFCLTFNYVDGDDKAVCGEWTRIAQAMTGSGKLQNCTNAKTKECTRLDCSGRISYSHSLLEMFPGNQIQFEYCFGSQLNSCKDPISVDFYLQVPNKNISMMTRISQDNVIDIPGLRVPLGPLGNAVPRLQFQFERGKNGSITYSVTLLVKVVNQIASYDVDQLRTTLIDRETIHAKHCDSIERDEDQMPSAAFNKSVSQCSPINFTSPTSTVAPKPHKPSATLNTTCDLINKICGHLEMCDSSVNPHVCVCQPEATMSSGNEACVTTSKLGQTCTLTAECGIHEKCNKTCQCDDGHGYDTWREICTLKRPGDHKDNHNDSTVPSPTSQSKQLPHKTSDESSKSGHHNLPIIIGASVGGVILVGLLIWGISFCQRRARRRLNATSISECRTPMLGNDDTDNLIM
ncbi:unnamed protein product [Lymnaea stagnalis]|uniref:Uncharacterized protein n=1 Tax=Lymnaea stagnalis TaxID=6523 RepID=A0AAV2I548_LYMST